MENQLMVARDFGSVLIYALNLLRLLLFDQSGFRRYEGPKFLV